MREETIAKFRRFLAQLLDATRAGKIRWIEEFDERIFRTTFQGGAVHLIEEESGSQPERYRASLLNANNTTVLEWESSQSEEAGFLKDLYQAARDAALRPDEVLDRMERELRAKVSAH